MNVVVARNVHAAYPILLSALQREGVVRPSRNGQVLRFAVPITTVYTRPTERVLFWPARDANPFFHFFEALWMLQGRNDLEFISEFTTGLGQFSDDGKTLNGAYGYRWREHFGVEQLALVVSALKENRDDRRQVISMWDATQDLGSKSRDVPCNTQAYVQVSVGGALDLMVTNRSNDIVWGMYGANAVHFSFLQEYLAACIGVPVGFYYQVSFNAHLYIAKHENQLGPQLDTMVEEPNPYEKEELAPVPICQTPKGRWDRQLSLLLISGPECSELTDPFLEGTARPLWRAWRAWKAGGPDRVDAAQRQLLGVGSRDWGRAAWEWLERRRG